MSVYDVPSGNWAEFFRRLTEQYRGQRLSVRTSSATPNADAPEATVLFSKLVLERIEFVVSEARPLVQLSVAESPQKFQFPFPTQVRFDQPNETSPGRIVIHLLPDRRVTLDFEEPLLKGSLNGLP